MTTTAQHIRTLFLHGSATYTIAEAASLLGRKPRHVRGWLHSGELEGGASGGEVVVPWTELVSLAMELWSQEIVEEALGADVAGTLPDLLRLSRLDVHIPRMQIIALERVAALESKTVSTILARELRDLVSVHSKWLSQKVPGFAEAFAWPEAAAFDREIS